MKYFAVICLFILVVITVASSDVNVVLKDHSGLLLPQTLQKSFDSATYSDIIAKCIGISPSSSRSVTPINNVSKRLRAALSIVSPVAFTNVKPTTTITSSDKKLSPLGVVLQALTSKNSCALGSNSYVDQLTQQDPRSLVLSFSGEESLADLFCGHYPTTAPVPGQLRSMNNLACVSLEGYLPISSPKLADPASNSLAGQILNPETRLVREQYKYQGLIEGFPQLGMRLSDDKKSVSISGSEYSLSVVSTLLDELAYLHHVGGEIDALSGLINDGSPDVHTFALSGFKKIYQDKEVPMLPLLQLANEVVYTSIHKFAAFYEDSMVSQIIISPDLLNTGDSAETCLDAASMNLLQEGGDGDDKDGGDGGDKDGDGGDKDGDDTKPQPQPTPASTVSNEDIRSYQIVLWLVLALVAACVFGFGATATMHIQPDNQLTGGAQTSFVRR